MREGEAGAGGAERQAGRVIPYRSIRDFLENK